ncbi:DUF5681 domain-containing protein [Mesorhizobium yinganensis]|uniref:DUF5681 domain-containing protein n=1 Tax=Mesorhizobium yinganensis TaxID=3157707 RepID=UPI003CCCA891
MANEPNSGQFQPGQSGNPRGRAAGSQSKVLVALDALGEGEAEAIVRAMIDKAKDGDAVAAKAILDRVWPPRRGARLKFDLPAAEDLPAAIAAVSHLVAEGEMSPDEGAVIGGPSGGAAQGHRDQRACCPRHRARREDDEEMTPSCTPD